MKDQLGSRMKDQYESRTSFKLMRRCPTIIRLDGKAFHTYTRGLDRPYDFGLIEDMRLTAKYLCENIQGAKLAYVQSDEISILLTDYETTKTDAWFDNKVQKICSVAASMCTAKFNQLRFLRSLNGYLDELNYINGFDYEEAPKLAFFDARVFQIADEEEVVNYFIWRQQDAVRNSIQMLAQSLYSPKELNRKNSNELQEMCFQKGKNWNDVNPEARRGSVVYKTIVTDSELFVQYMTTTEMNVTVARLKEQGEEVKTYWKEEAARILTQERFFIKRLLV